MVIATGHSLIIRFDEESEKGWLGSVSVQEVAREINTREGERRESTKRERGKTCGNEQYKGGVFQRQVDVFLTLLIVHGGTNIHFLCA